MDLLFVETNCIFWWWIYLGLWRCVSDFTYFVLF